MLYLEFRHVCLCLPWKCVNAHCFRVLRCCCCIWCTVLSLRSQSTDIFRYAVKKRVPLILCDANAMLILIFLACTRHHTHTHHHHAEYFYDFPPKNFTSLALPYIGTLRLWPVNVITPCFIQHIYIYST